MSEQTPTSSLRPSGEMPATRAATVAAELRRLILSGALRSGTKLRQVEVSERFGVSTTPVREAFATLAREGLLSQDAHKGVRVRLPSHADLQDNYEIRLLLEPFATELAAKRLTDEELGSLAADLARIDDSYEDSGPEAETIRSEANTHFHRTIYAAAGRPRLAEIIEQLRNASAVYIRIASTFPPPAYRAQTAREHQQVLAALERREGGKAAAVMREHLLHNLSHISGVLEELATENPEEIGPDRRRKR